MAVVKEFTLPDLGEGLTEAEIVRWLVEVGDVVAIDQPVVEVETAKAVVEVPCPYGGVVTARFGAEGDTLDVGRPLVTVAVGSRSDGGSAEGGSPGQDSADEGSGNVLVGYGTGTAVARRRGRVRAVSAAAGAGAVALAPGVPSDDGGAVAGGPVTGGPSVDGSAVDGSAVAGSGVGGSVAGEPVVDGPVAVISPLVRRLAREHGLDLRALAGTGPDGLILRADVERAVAGAGAGAASAPQGAGERRPPSGGFHFGPVTQNGTGQVMQGEFGDITINHRPDGRT
jgi:2-oxoisovalerate dehydrogenase E2 component (dihydrolipoyl transacylase)